MDEATRRALTTELETAVRERDRLGVVIAYLGDRLGVVPDPGIAGGGNSEPARVINPHGAPIDAVNPGQFHGMSAAKAARALLQLFGRDRPMKPREIYDAITKGGVTIKDPEIVYRAMKRNKGFTRLPGGLWGLSEWYPDSKRAPIPDDNGGSGEDEHEEPGEEAPEVSPKDDGGESD